jgi:anthranilate phosphoribosyltransferase
VLENTLAKVLERGDLTTAEAASAMGWIMDGRVTPAQISAFVTAMRMKGETVPEIVGCAQAMRKRALRVKTPSGPVMDVCGTGGDGKGTFNISTTSAVVVAAAGVPVAKHGNRAASSKCGSTDLLEALGLRIDLSRNRLERILRKVGITYMHAPAHHPAMKHAVPVRKEIGFRTVFNILGPLCNPAFVKTQSVGVFHPDLLLPYAQVLKKLGSRSVFVYHGAGGLDELSTLGVNRVVRLKGGAIFRISLHPGSVGLKKGRLRDLAGGTRAENARITKSILKGEKGPRRDVVLFNAGVALVAAGKVKRPRDGVRMAAEAIDNGSAWSRLQEWIEATR